MRARSWTLDGQSFDRLLLLLDPDRDRAGERYELIRTQLVRIFEWRGCPYPESLADETIDRVGRRLEQGEQIRAADPALYFYGVARNVLKEYWTERRRETGTRMAEASARVQESSTPEERERELRLDCLDRCMEKLPAERRRLIERYYGSDPGGKIEDRAALAKDLGIAAGTLRIRAHRIRRILEACVNDCMRGKSGSEGEA